MVFFPWLFFLLLSFLASADPAKVANFLASFLAVSADPLSWFFRGPYPCLSVRWFFGSKPPIPSIVFLTARKRGGFSGLRPLGSFMVFLMGTRYPES